MRGGRAAALGLGLVAAAAALLGLGLGPTASGSALGRSEPERAAHNRVVGLAVRFGALGPLGTGRPPNFTPPP
jgi:hypothetical protein